MTAMKRFHLRVVLTVTTRRLLTQPRGDNDNGIGDLHDILGWMTNDSPFTHQLPRFGEECEPWLLRWFPELRAVNESLPQLDRMMSERGALGGIELWLTNLLTVGAAKEFYDVPRIPRDDHDHRNPIEELAEKIGPERIIVVDTPRHES